jgi:hypothetical protein
VGLLLLRIAVGATAIIQGGVLLSNHAHPIILDWVVGLAVIAAAAFVLIGFLTPVMGTLTGLGIIGTSLSRLPAVDPVDNNVVRSEDIGHPCFHDGCRYCFLRARSILA